MKENDEEEGRKRKGSGGEGGGKEKERRRRRREDEKEEGRKRRRKRREERSERGEREGSGTKTLIKSVFTRVHAATKRVLYLLHFTVLNGFFFLLAEIGSLFPEESQLQQSRTTQPTR